MKSGMMRSVASLKLKSAVVQEFNLARERNEVRRLVFATGTGRRSVACQPHKIAAVERGGGKILLRVSLLYTVSGWKVSEAR